MNKREKRLKAERFAKRRDEKHLQQSAEVALETLNVLPVYVLRTMFGFGNERCERYIREFHRIYHAMVNHEVSYEQIRASVEAETGLKYKPGEMEWYNMRKEETAE